MEEPEIAARIESRLKQARDELRRLEAAKLVLEAEDVDKVLRVPIGHDGELAEILEDLMASGQLDGTGYTAEDVDELLAGLDALPD